jgi:hypothetical protein
VELETYFSDDHARAISSSDREKSLRRIRSADLAGRTATSALASSEKPHASNGSGKKNKTEARDGS